MIIIFKYGLKGEKITIDKTKMNSIKSLWNKTELKRFVVNSDYKRFISENYESWLNRSSTWNRIKFRKNLKFGQLWQSKTFR